MLIPANVAGDADEGHSQSYLRPGTVSAFDDSSLRTNPIELLPDPVETHESGLKTAVSMARDLYEALRKRKTTSTVEKYLRTTEAIDGFELVKELKALIDELETHFYPDPGFARVNELYEKANLLEKLVRLALTPPEYSRLKAMQGQLG